MGRSHTLGIVVTLLLLVVFIGMFGPMLFQARENVHPPPSCLSNLKQLGLALEQYAYDFDHRYPWHAGVEDPTAAWVDLGLLFPTYCSSERVFLCPSSTDRWFEPMSPSGYKIDYPLEPFAPANTAEVISYAYGVDARTDTPTAWTENAPSTVRLLADKKAGERADDHSNHKHNGRNVLYQDGHVKWQEGNSALDPDETDSVIGPPGQPDYTAWWSDPPFYGE